MATTFKNSGDLALDGRGLFGTNATTNGSTGVVQGNSSCLGRGCGHSATAAGDQNVSISDFYAGSKDGGHSEGDAGNGYGNFFWEKDLAINADIPVLNEGFQGASPEVRFSDFYGARTESVAVGSTQTTTFSSDTIAFTNGDVRTKGMYGQTGFNYLLNTFHGGVIAPNYHEFRDINTDYAITSTQSGGGAATFAFDPSSLGTFGDTRKRYHNNIGGVEGEGGFRFIAVYGGLQLFGVLPFLMIAIEHDDAGATPGNAGWDKLEIRTSSSSVPYFTINRTDMTFYGDSSYAPYIDTTQVPSGKKLSYWVKYGGLGTHPLASSNQSKDGDSLVLEFRGN